MKTKYEDFDVLIPNFEGTDIAERIKVIIPLRFDEETGDWVLTEEAHEIIESTKARHMGLLLPEQFKLLRKRLNLSQKEMGELFQVGEKSWTRWESGNQRPSRVISLLIKGVFEGAIPVNYLLKQAGKQPISDCGFESNRWWEILSSMDSESNANWPFIRDRSDTAILGIGLQENSRNASCNAIHGFTKWVPKLEMILCYSNEQKNYTAEVS
ncbi:hypothetical protein FEM03_02605 [Phragmitibacter flavus]|uniref:HTH cro/C1-type domain-containing protein n=1 Tax=Phragmitibacter flavus TaxID=2576071 RepID=A0A5R8KK05_9BACT|nr:helix-turn-helix domain-containing protein [Phragmitibacter flavus]TLD72265.1 hypothetical protein FEM03_02605 [Phragmitibacter flavus]